MIDHETLLEVQAIGEQRRAERRRFIKMASAGLVATGGLATLSACGDSNSSSLPPDLATPTPSPTATTSATDIAVLNFALNLEYLEANYYNFGVQNAGLNPSLTTGTGTQGTVTGGRQVNFADASVAAYIREIASDEIAHVLFLRSQLGSAAVAQPAINIDGSATGAFTAAARAAGVVSATGTFDPYANDDNFLLGAMLLTDVGVTAYKGSATLINSKVILEAAAGILAVEAYHSGLLRTLLYRRSVQTPAPTATAPMDRQNQALISAARDNLDGTTSQTASAANPVQLYANDDQSIGPVTFTPPTTANGTVRSNIVPADSNAIVFGRKAANVLNIAYLNKAAVTSGGFFPNGVNGSIKASAANS